MLWGVVTGMVHCGVVLRWADVHTDDAPRKVPGAFQDTVRWGGGGVEVRGRAMPAPSQIHQAMQPISHTRRNEPNGAESGEQPRKAKRSIDRPQGRPFIVCHDKQQAASSAGASPSPRPRPRPSRCRGRSEWWPGISHRGEKEGRGNGSTGQSKWELTT